MGEYKLPPKDLKYFSKFARNIIFGTTAFTGLAGLFVANRAVTVATIQYFNEMKMAVINGELNILNAAPLYCCVGPVLLGFAAMYRQKKKKEDAPIWVR